MKEQEEKLQEAGKKSIQELDADLSDKLLYIIGHLTCVTMIF